jgi:hypothetical protein
MKPVNPVSTNPMVKAFGEYHIRDVKCKTCEHFIRKELSKTFFKCAFRGNTNGPGTDHRANWPACTKYQKR